MDCHLAGIEPGAQAESSCFHQDQETDVKGVTASLTLQPFMIFKLFYVQNHI